MRSGVTRRFAAPGAVPAAAVRTPIWLVDGELPAGHPPVLVNLGADMPPQPGVFERIIEVVGADVDDEQRGRQRWRGYRALGVEVQHHAASGRGAGGSSAEG